MVVWGLVTVPAFICFMVWFWVRVYYLPVPALMLEPVGIFGALRAGLRAHPQAVLAHLRHRRCSRCSSCGIAGYVLALPIGIVGQVATLAVGAQYALLVLVVTQALSQVISSAFVTPFTSAVTSLQYLDQRMRKEAYDVELMQQAGITGW